ncbi:A24 family peptidase [Massilia sp. PWRC2]|uniref:A24 family peptidase n=1 Tax=Massilia sp. PWRC2 TaxID=2804626 RepID=UPI003CF01323
MTSPLYAELLLVVTVVLAASTDLISRRIPNRLLMLCGLGAIGLHLAGPHPTAHLLTALGGAATGLAVFLPLYLLRGMAAGDVKLLATAGLFLSPREVLWLAVLTVCAGGVMGLAVLLWRGRWRDAWRNVATLLRPWWMRLAGVHLAPEALPKGSVGNLPYGLAIASATLFFLAQRHC